MERARRRSAVLEIPVGRLAEMVRPAGPDARVVAAEPLGGGLINTLYKISLAGDARPVVVRVYDGGPAVARKEADLAGLLQGRVPVPGVLHSDPGSPGIPAFAVIEWLEGLTLAALFQDGAARDAAEPGCAIGAVAARIGSFHFPRAGLFGPGLEIATPFDGLTGAYLEQIRAHLRQGRAGRRLGRPLADGLLERTAANVDRLAELDGLSRLVHADFNPSNILLAREAGRWCVSGVLDWEFALSGAPLFDVGTLFRDGETRPRAFTTAFARAYRDEGGILPSGWRATAALLDILGRIESLESEDLEQGEIEAERARIARLLNRWTELDREPD